MKLRRAATGILLLVALSLVLSGCQQAAQVWFRMDESGSLEFAACRGLEFDTIQVEYFSQSWQQKDGPLLTQLATGPTLRADDSEIIAISALGPDWESGIDLPSAGVWAEILVSAYTTDHSGISMNVRLDALESHEWVNERSLFDTPCAEPVEGELTLAPGIEDLDP